MCLKDALISFALAGATMCASALLVAGPQPHHAAVARLKAAGGEAWLSDWDGDNASGTKYISYNGGLNEKTLTGDDGGVTWSTTDIRFQGNNTSSYWTNSSNDLFSDEEGTLFYTVAWTDSGDSDLSATAHIEFSDTATSDSYYLYCTNGTGNPEPLRIHWNDGTNSFFHDNAGLSYNGTYRIGVAWQTSTNSLSSSIVSVGSAPSWSDDSGITMVNWPTDCAVYRVGEYNSGYFSADGVILKDMRITTTFKDDDPQETP